MRRPQWIPLRSDLQGLGLAVGIGMLAWLAVRSIPSTPFLSEVLVALVLGALALNTRLRHLLGLALPGPDREPDNYAPGLRFVGKWVLRLAIILMGFKVQAGVFGSGDLVLIAGVAVVALPSTFFITHALAAAVKMRRPMADLLAAGTMICGASVVNAVAPVARAHREEQATAIAVITLFSCTALILFRPIALAVAMVGVEARGSHAGAALIGGLALLFGFSLYRLGNRQERQNALALRQDVRPRTREMLRALEGESNSSGVLADAQGDLTKARLA